MQSINSDVNSIHQAFCDARDLELNMHPTNERWWFDALKCGMTPDDVKLVIKSRMKRIAAGVRHEESLYIRNIAGSEEAIANTMEEAAAIRATMRIKAYPAGKAQALRATGRDDEPEQGGAVPISEVIQAMRREVG